jgi:hypothetical protein
LSMVFDTWQRGLRYALNRGTSAGA